MKKQDAFGVSLFSIVSLCVFVAGIAVWFVPTKSRHSKSPGTGEFPARSSDSAKTTIRLDIGSERAELEKLRQISATETAEETTLSVEYIELDVAFYREAAAAQEKPPGDLASYWERFRIAKNKVHDHFNRLESLPEGGTSKADWNRELTELDRETLKDHTARKAAREEARNWLKAFKEGQVRCGTADVGCLVITNEGTKQIPSAKITLEREDLKTTAGFYDMDDFMHYATGEEDAEETNEPSPSRKPRNLPVEILDLGTLRPGEQILVPLYVEEACWVIGKYRELLSPPGQSRMRELLYLPKELNWRAESEETTKTISGRSLFSTPHRVSWNQRWYDYEQ